MYQAGVGGKRAVYSSRPHGAKCRRVIQRFATKRGRCPAPITCAGWQMIGTHRFIHTLDPYGDTKPVISYDPAQVGVTWDELHSDDAQKKSG